MLNRRTAFTRLALGLCSGVCGWLSCMRFPRRNGHTAAEVARQEAQLAKLVRPDYSEDGVPVLLAMENLGPAPTPDPGKGNTDGARLAAEFRTMAELYRAAHPDAGPADVPKLVELLAAQDFGNLDRP